MTFAAGAWRPVAWDWSAVHSGVVLSDTPNITAPRDGVPIKVVVRTLCKEMQVDLDGVPRDEGCTVAQFARQCQIVASSIHYGSRGCRKCLELFAAQLTPHEREFLNTSDPAVGKAVGVSIVKPGDPGFVPIDPMQRATDRRRIRS